MRTRVVDLELQEGAVEPVSLRYGAVRLLLRRRGLPVGVIQVGTTPAELAPVSVRMRGVEAAEWALAQDLLAHELVRREVPAAAPSISVVVCTRDRPDALRGCLAALEAQQYRGAYEVIVVDNASRDERTREVTAAFAVRYEHEARPGLDWARNHGIAAAAHEIVAFTDDDARPDARWLEAIGRGFASPDVHGVTGLVAPAELETEAQWLFEDVYGGMGKGFRTRLHCRRGKRARFTPNIYGTGCNMAFRRETLQRLGGFDPALDVGTPAGGGGDLDMFQRLIEDGAALVYRPDALVRHVHRRTVDGLRRQLYDNGRAYSAVLWKCFVRARGLDRIRVVRTYGRWFYWWHLRRALRRIRKHEPMPMALIRAELVGGLLGPFLYRRSRRHARRVAAEHAS